MSPGQAVLLVVGILAGIGLLQAAIWIPLIRRLRRLPGRLRAELASSGETLLRAPERGTYRGSTATGYPRAAGTGVVALTDRRLVFRPMVGRAIDVPISQIEGIREEKWFLGSMRAGRTHLVLRLRDGGEVGFLVRDPRAWIAALRPVGARAGA